MNCREKCRTMKGLTVKITTCAITAFVMLLFLVDNNSLKFTKSRSRVRRSQPSDDKCQNGEVRNEESKSCVCLLGWIGSRCNVWHDHYCYFDNGQNYGGKLSVTKSGQTCAPWTTDDNKLFELGKNGVGVHNYCRNPDNDENGPWCYVGGDEFMGYCNTTRCPDAVKELLSRNTSEVGPADDTSAAVQFLFGPLISGVCAGVVVLLAFIAVAEYARRKKYFTRKKKKNRKSAESDIEKGEYNPSFQDEKNKDEKLSKERDDRSDVRPLGGIVTVDVDTGKKKIHKYYRHNDMKKGSKVFLPEYGSGNGAFVRRMNDEHANDLEMGPPPVYSPEDVVRYVSLDRGEAATPHESLVTIPEKKVPRRQKHRRRAGRRLNSNSESLQSVLEESTFSVKSESDNKETLCPDSKSTKSRRSESVSLESKKAEKVSPSVNKQQQNSEVGNYTHEARPRKANRHSDKSRSVEMDEAGSTDSPSRKGHKLHQKRSGSLHTGKSVVLEDNSGERRTEFNTMSQKPVESSRPTRIKNTSSKPRAGTPKRSYADGTAMNSHSVPPPKSSRRSRTEDAHRRKRRGTEYRTSVDQQSTVDPGIPQVRKETHERRPRKLQSGDSLIPDSALGMKVSGQSTNLINHGNRPVTGVNSRNEPTTFL